MPGIIYFLVFIGSPNIKAILRVLFYRPSCVIEHADVQRQVPASYTIPVGPVTPTSYVKASSRNAEQVVPHWSWATLSPPQDQETS